MRYMRCVAEFLYEGLFRRLITRRVTLGRPCTSTRSIFAMSDVRLFSCILVVTTISSTKEISNFSAYILLCEFIVSLEIPSDIIL